MAPKPRSLEWFRELKHEKEKTLDVFITNQLREIPIGFQQMILDHVRECEYAAYRVGQLSERQRLRNALSTTVLKDEV